MDGEQTPGMKTMNNSTLCLKPVSALLHDGDGQSAQYWIPAYQRGYRWSPLQVKQLLDDIWEWETESRRKKSETDEFYCLQPLVLKVDGGRFEVVDGQQRLTTILLILNHFNRRLVEGERKQLFTISFATRPSIDELLANPTEEVANLNVDFFHVFEAIKEIREWFRQHPHSTGDMESALLNRTQVIWFELAATRDCLAVDSRFQAGAEVVNLTRIVEDRQNVRARFLPSDYLFKHLDDFVEEHIVRLLAFLERFVLLLLLERGVKRQSTQPYALA